MTKKVNELANEYKERFSINLAAFLQKEYKYKAIEKIIEYELDE